MNKRLAEIFAEVFGLNLADIQPDLQKSEVGTWDSLKQMDLVMSLEHEYAITLGISDIKRMLSVAEIMTVLKEKGVDLGS